MKLKLQLIEGEFSICKVEDLSKIKFDDQYLFLSITDEEISVVCHSDMVPENATDIENSFRAIRIVGILDFSIVGIIAKISEMLTAKGISIFVISTYNTDYILFNKDSLEKTVEVLTARGCSFNGMPNN